MRWLETTEGRQVIRSLSKQTVQDLAPEELEVFDDLIAEHFENPAPPNADDEPLAFGGSLLVAVTPGVALAVEAVLKFLLDEVLKTSQQESAALISQKIKALFHPVREKKDPAVVAPASPPALTRPQLEKVKQLARKEALRSGLLPRQADDLANLLVARLALAG